jgi:hypothetical protein
MKRLILSVLLLPSVMHANVIKCPERFPANDTVLPASPSYGSASVRVTEARLSNAYFLEGPIYSPRMVIPNETDVKGGFDVKFGFLPDLPRWLVCKYGGERWGTGNIERWERMPDTINSCVQKVREIKIPHSTSDWTAAAVCK